MKYTFCKRPNHRNTSGINRNQKIHRTFHKCPDYLKSPYLIPAPRTPASANFKADIHTQTGFDDLEGSQNCLYLLFREEKGIYWLKRRQNKNLVRDQYVLERIWFSATMLLRVAQKGSCQNDRHCWKESWKESVLEKISRACCNLLTFNEISRWPADLCFFSARRLDCCCSKITVTSAKWQHSHRLIS